MLHSTVVWSDINISFLPTQLLRLHPEDGIIVASKSFCLFLWRPHVLRLAGDYRILWWLLFYFSDGISYHISAKATSKCFTESFAGCNEFVLKEGLRKLFRNRSLLSWIKATLRNVVSTEKKIYMEVFTGKAGLIIPTWCVSPCGHHRVDYIMHTGFENI